MDVISNLGLGFSVALTIQNIAYCFIGTLLGTLIGVLPGIGPVTTVAMLLPISFTLPPESAMILLAGIYYGAQYGGSTTAILINIPGEASSVVTTIDGHAMARQGRAGPALGIAALGSFFAGCAATLLIALAAPPLATIALQFGPAEYFSLMVCGLIAAVVLARGSLLKAIAMVVLGLLLGLVGTDMNSGARRFNFGMTGLADGIEFVAISMAIYGIAEVVYNLEQKQVADVVAGALGRVWPSFADVKQCAGSILRGTGIRQQCGRADIVHPDVDAGHPWEPDHGDDDRGADDSRHSAGSARDDRSSGAVLGAHRQHVARQSHACGVESSDGRHLGEIAARAVSAALSRHHRVLLHRCLYHQ